MCCEGGDFLAKSSKKEGAPLRRYLKIGAVSLFSGLFVSTVLLVLFAAIMNAVDIGTALVAAMALAAVMCGALFSSYICGRIARQKGLVIGLFFGALYYMLLFVLGSLFGSGLGAGLLIARFAALILAGILGGIMGVNGKPIRVK